MRQPSALAGAQPSPLGGNVTRKKTAYDLARVGQVWHLIEPIDDGTGWNATARFDSEADARNVFMRLTDAEFRADRQLDVLGVGKQWYLIEVLLHGKQWRTIARFTSGEDDARRICAACNTTP